MCFSLSDQEENGQGCGLPRELVKRMPVINGEKRKRKEPAVGSGTGTTKGGFPSGMGCTRSARHMYCCCCQLSEDHTMVIGICTCMRTRDGKSTGVLVGPGRKVAHQAHERRVSAIQLRLRITCVVFVGLQKLSSKKKRGGHNTAVGASEVLPAFRKFFMGIDENFYLMPHVFKSKTAE